MATKKHFTDFDNLNLIKLGYGDLIFGSSQFSLLPQLPQKTMFDLKVVKRDSYGSLDACNTQNRFLKRSHIDMDKERDVFMGVRRIFSRGGQNFPGGRAKTYYLP